MRYGRLQDRLYRSLGTAARHTGQWGSAFRPTSQHAPLVPENRYLKLPVAFEPMTKADGADAFSHFFWRGIFDGSYTRGGDYLVVGGQVYFIASQEPLQPIVCVRTNRIVSIARSTQVPGSTAGNYGSFSPASASAFLTDYPAGVLVESKTSSSAAGLPTDQAIPYWTIYLPTYGKIAILPGDYITDDMGRSAVVSYTERSIMGWRLIAKTATT